MLAPNAHYDVMEKIGTEGISMDDELNGEKFEVMNQRSQSPEAPMNLIMRFETASGPRTVIACSVPRHIAAEISDVLNAAGQHAKFVDRYSPLSISDRLLMREIEQVPHIKTDTMRHDWHIALGARKAAGVRREQVA